MAIFGWQTSKQAVLCAFLRAGGVDAVEGEFGD
jgi:hypothetical protein